MTMNFWLATTPWALYSACAVLGLVAGSFLNVVIMRLPAMLEAQWREEARLLLGVSDGEDIEIDEDEVPALSLWHPPSSCRVCWARIRPWQNIPLLSWLALRGRAACCGTRISMQYPLVELAGAVLAVGAAWRFGYGLDVLAAMLLSWTLLCAGVIDCKTQLLPDALTLPLLWLGLLFNLDGGFVTLESAVLGAALGYLSLWLIYHTFRLVTGREGLGYGDFKLLAALGAWLGWQALPMLLLVASAAGALFGLLLLISGRLHRGQPMPFGPFLAGAGLVSLYFHDGAGGLAWF